MYRTVPEMRGQIRRRPITGNASPRQPPHQQETITSHRSIIDVRQENTTFSIDYLSRAEGSAGGRGGRGFRYFIRLNELIQLFRYSSTTFNCVRVVTLSKMI